MRLASSRVARFFFCRRLAADLLAARSRRRLSSSSGSAEGFSLAVAGSSPGGRDGARWLAWRLNPSRCSVLPSRCSVQKQVPLVFRIPLGVPLPFGSPSVFRCLQVPLGVPVFFGPPRCSGAQPCSGRGAASPPFCGLRASPERTISARVTLRGGYRKCRLQ